MHQQVSTIKRLFLYLYLFFAFISSSHHSLFDKHEQKSTSSVVLHESDSQEADSRKVWRESIQKHESLAQVLSECIDKISAREEKGMVCFVDGYNKLIEKKSTKHTATHLHLPGSTPSFHIKALYYTITFLLASEQIRSLIENVDLVGVRTFDCFKTAFREIQTRTTHMIQSNGYEYKNQMPNVTNLALTMDSFSKYYNIHYTSAEFTVLYEISRLLNFFSTKTSSNSDGMFPKAFDVVTCCQCNRSSPYAVYNKFYYVINIQSTLKQSLEAQLNRLFWLSDKEGCSELDNKKECCEMQYFTSNRCREPRGGYLTNLFICKINIQDRNVRLPNYYNPLQTFAIPIMITINEKPFKLKGAMLKSNNVFKFMVFGVVFLRNEKWYNLKNNQIIEVPDIEMFLKDKNNIHYVIYEQQ